MEIRRATPADLAQIRRLEEQSSTAAHWSIAQYDALFSVTAPSRAALIAQSEGSGEILGFAIARCLPDEWELENIVVDESHQKRGIGAVLLRRLLADAQAAGARSIILEVRECNGPARRLYESTGFTVEGRRKGYYRDPVEDAILYRSTLQICDKMP